MSKIKFELNRKGVKELLKSDEMIDVLDDYAKKVQNKCGDGYERDSRKGKNRGNIRIFTTDPKALQDNLDNNTLLKALNL